MTPQKTIYALLVGINQYSRKPLNGCVKDTEFLEKTLKALSLRLGFGFKPKRINDSAATRINVKENFIKHFSDATQDDILIFYFSGHGAQEKCDPQIWESEGDSKLEGLVCSDSIETGLLLADKELRYLISKIKSRKAHLLTIFDCCHSGENTRKHSEKDKNNQNYIESRIFKYSNSGNAFPVRKWSDFQFERNINSPKDLETRSHIQLSACESSEVSYETFLKEEKRIGGVFTNALIKELELYTDGDTYLSLIKKVRLRLDDFFKQNPTGYGEGRLSLNDKIFSNSAFNLFSTGNVFFSDSKNSWILDLGSINGISIDCEVRVLNKSEPYYLEIKEIYEFFTKLKVPLSFKNKKCKAEIIQLKKRTGFSFSNEIDKQNKSFGKDLTLWFESTQSCAKIFEGENVKYQINIKENWFFISDPNFQYKPLCLPVKIDDEQSLKKAQIAINHIGFWDYVLRLKPTENKHPINELISIELINESNNTTKDIKDFLEEEVSSAMTYKLKVTNNSDEKIYVNTLFLKYDFSVSDHLFGALARPLNPGDFYISRAFETPFPKEKLIFNWPYLFVYLKFFLSLKPFFVNNFKMKKLPQAKSLFLKGNTRGIDLEISNKFSTNFSWATETIKLKIINEEYNRLEKDKIQEYENTKASYFLNKIYKDV